MVAGQHPRGWNGVEKRLALAGSTRPTAYTKVRKGPSGRPAGTGRRLEPQRSDWLRSTNISAASCKGRAERRRGGTRATAAKPMRP